MGRRMTRGVLMKLRSWLVAAAAGATLLAGCGSSSTPATGSGATGGSSGTSSAAPTTDAPGDASALLTAALGVILLANLSTVGDPARALAGFFGSGAS